MIDPNMTVEQLEADIVEYIGGWYALPLRSDMCRNPGIPTFAVLENRYGRPRIGGTDLELTGYKNVILWQNLSQNLAQAIVALCVNLQIHWHPTFVFFYITEGRPLALPLARWPITEEYDKPHWLPVDFHLGPSCDGGGCPGRTHDSH